VELDLELDNELQLKPLERPWRCIVCQLELAVHLVGAMGRQTPAIAWRHNTSLAFRCERQAEKKKHSLVHTAQPSHPGEFILLRFVLEQRAPNTDQSFSDRASTRIFEKWRGRRRWQSTKFSTDASAFLIQRLIFLKAGSGAQPRPNLNDNLVSKVIPVLWACGNRNCCGVPHGCLRRSLMAWFGTFWRKLPQRFFGKEDLALWLTSSWSSAVPGPRLTYSRAEGA